MVTPGLPEHPPIAAADTWRPVMVAAGYRCQCHGSCGARHAAAAGGRCDREHKQWAPLVTGPARPTGDPHRDITTDQVAWCGPCYDRTRTRVRKEQATAAPPVPAVALFDL